jgi:hypothetical protein
MPCNCTGALVGFNTTPLLSFMSPVFDEEDVYTPMQNVVIGDLPITSRETGGAAIRVNAGISLPGGDFLPVWPHECNAMSNDVRPGAWSKFNLVGVTRDSAGAALGGVTVKVFRTNGDSITPFTAVSDGSGNFSLDVGAERGPFYYRDDKAGSPYKAGTSINTITPTES